MSIPDPHRVAEMRRVIRAFLSARLDARLQKIAADDLDAAEKQVQLRQQFDAGVWLKDAATRVGWIQAVTHSLKPTHPSARGTNLYCAPQDLPAHGLLGSNALGPDRDIDVVGNAAALDVYQLLMLSVAGRTFLDLMLAGDADLLVALSDNADEAQAWVDAFTSIIRPRGTPSSDTLAKQLYWLTGDDPHQDGSYHLLAPLFATSLTHRVYQTIDADRFSEESKNARTARKESQFTDHVLHDYPNMAVQTLGGSKPQNISHLNSARRGKNYLLASLPPQWKSADVAPLLNGASMFQWFERRSEVKRSVEALRAFLKGDPAANLSTRLRRDALVEELAGELLAFAAELRTLPAGWSQSPDCRLSSAERQWLDPDGMPSAAEPTANTVLAGSHEPVSHGFGRWLNQQLRDPLPMGDPEYLYWAALMQAELDAEGPEAHHAA